MNTQSISITSSSSRISKGAKVGKVQSLDFAGRLVRWLAAATIAIAVIIAGTWAATNPALTQYLSAGFWAMGFVYFALALEVNIRRVLPLIMTGLALPALALLGSRVAEEFFVLAVAVIAAWLMFWIGRRD